MNKQKGIVKAVSEKNRSVLVEFSDATGLKEDKWMPLQDNIQCKWIHQGEAEVSFTDDLIVTFIKNTASASASSKSPTTYNKKIEDASPEMKRMAALKYASQIYMGTGQEPDFKRLSEECQDYIEKGVWQTEEKL